MRDASHRDRAATQHTSKAPPGRLRVRPALAADAQRAAGRRPTAEPWIRTVHRHVPCPPLKVGVAVDVSGSMPFAEPLAAAWSHATAATVCFANEVTAVTRPGQVPAQVCEFAAAGGSTGFPQAVDALDGVLGLARAGDGARLLVVVSDGHYPAAQRASGQARVRRLVAAGCGVLWLALPDDVTPMDGAHLVLLDDPAAAGAVIGAAAQRPAGRAMTQPAATSPHRRTTAAGPPDDTHPHTDGTGAGLLAFCVWLGEQGLVAGKEAENLHLAVRRVLSTTDDWQRLDIRSLDPELAARRFDASAASSLRPKSRAAYQVRFRKAVRLYLAYLDDPAEFRIPRPPAAVADGRPPHDDGTAAGLVGFCQWLAEQGLVSARRADQMCQAVRRVLAPDPDWERLDVRRLDVDGLLARLATATTPPLRLSTLNFCSSGFRMAVRLYLAYLDDPAGFHATGTVMTRWRTHTVPGDASLPAAHHPAAPPVPTIAYPFPLRGAHTIWLRLPADLTRDEAHRLATFIHALAVDPQPPPDPATTPETVTASRRPREDASPT